MLCLSGTLRPMGAFFSHGHLYHMHLLVSLDLHRLFPKQLSDTSFPSNKHSFNEGAEPVLQRQGLVSVLSQPSLVTLVQSLPPHCVSSCSGLVLSRDGFGIGSMCISGDLRSRLQIWVS